MPVRSRTNFIASIFLPLDISGRSSASIGCEVEPCGDGIAESVSMEPQ